MKKLSTLFITAIFSCTALLAQNTDIRKAMERYKGVNTLTGVVTRTKHNVAIVSDVVTQGNLYFKAPDKLCMVFSKDKDMLLMENNTFTMMNDGQKSIAKGKTQSQFESLLAVFKNIISGEDNSSDINRTAEVEITKQGNTRILTITPVVSGSTKIKRKLMFTSFVLSIDLQSSEFKSLRMNEPGGNYTQYDFSDYVFNAK